MTFSIVARCAETGQFGVAISSSSPAVGARCAFARAGTGAAASQNVTNPALGPFVLDRLAEGMTACSGTRLRHPARRSCTGPPVRPVPRRRRILHRPIAAIPASRTEETSADPWIAQQPGSRHSASGPHSASA